MDRTHFGWSMIKTCLTLCHVSQGSPILLGRNSWSLVTVTNFFYSTSYLIISGRLTLPPVCIESQPGLWFYLNVKNGHWVFERAIRSTNSNISSPLFHLMELIVNDYRLVVRGQLFDQWWVVHRNGCRSRDRKE